MRSKQMRRVCVILPNKLHLDCAVGMKARGRDVLDNLLRQLAVSDLQVFGLAVLKDNEYLFLNLEKSLSRYFGKRWDDKSVKVPFILSLRVQFYVENGLLILSSSIQELYYTELRQKALFSQSRHEEAVFFQLAASALQAEDLQHREGKECRKRDYFLPENYFPEWLIKRRGKSFLLQHGSSLHRDLKGFSRTKAILQFIKEAYRLEDVVVTIYRMRRNKRELRSSILLGVLMTGVHIYQEVKGKQCISFDFSWADIDRFTIQGSRFEITAVASLCLPQLVYYTHSAFHSKHILKHISDSHRLHITNRKAVRYIQQLEDWQTSHLFKEAYICDTTNLRDRLRSLTSSISDSSAERETTTTSIVVEEEDCEDPPSGVMTELSMDEEEEIFIDNPDDLSWLVDLLYGVSVDGPLMLPSSPWAAVTMEMKQVLWRKACEEESVD